MRVGSRTDILSRMSPGEELFLRAGVGRASILMQQISTDIGRAGLRGLISQSLVLGIEVSTREVVELIFVRRKE